MKPAKIGVAFGEKDGPHMRRCSRCKKVFSSRAGASDHIVQVHKGDGVRIAVQRQRPAEGEESLADIAIEAMIKRASGDPLDPLEESLLP